MNLTVVINGSYGGFSLNKEMAEWLRDNKGWKVAPSDTYPSNDYDLVFCGDDSVYPSTKWKSNDSMAFRSHPDFVECVRWLKWKYRNYDKHRSHQIEDRYLYSSISHAHDLCIVEVRVSVEVGDKYDGIENIHVNHCEDEEENPKSTDDLILDAQWIINNHGKASQQMKEFREKFAKYPELEDAIKMANDLLFGEQ
jgi:hypothetical protein